MVRIEHARGVARRSREQPPRRLEPVEPRHPDVHQHEVGSQPPRRVQRLLAVDGLAGDLEVVLGVDEHAQARPHEVLVVGDQDPDAHRGDLRQRQPRPRRGSPRRRGRGELAAAGGDALAIPRSPVPVPPTVAAGALADRPPSATSTRKPAGSRTIETRTASAPRGGRRW